VHDIKLKSNEQPQKAKKFFEKINIVADLLGIFVALAIFITILIQITGRLIRNPAPWTEEATRFLFIWMIFLGIGMGFRRCESTRITIFLDYMPSVIRRFSKWIYILSSIGFFVFMIIYGANLAQQQFKMNEIGSAFMIPMWLVGISVPVSGVIGILGVIENVLFYPDLLEIKGDED
jgi:TRAP-type C4-dicarboxylate transport system permease small subunit